MTAVMPETMAQLVRERGLLVTEKDLVAALDEALLGCDRDTRQRGNGMILKP